MSVIYLKGGFEVSYACIIMLNCIKVTEICLYNIDKMIHRIMQTIDMQIDIQIDM